MEMQLIFKAVISGGFAACLLYFLLQYALGRRKRRPEDGPTWVAVVFTFGGTLAATAVFASAVMEGSRRWQDQLMYIGIVTMGIGAECDVLASLFGRQSSGEMNHWAVRLVLAVIGSLMVYFGAGRLAN